jgi:hypothetical protein
MRTTTVLVTLALFSFLVPVASAGPTDGCPAGVVPLVNCVVGEASGEASRDVGVAIGIVNSVAKPVHDGVCTILYGSPKTCPVWDAIVSSIGNISYN